LALSAALGLAVPCCHNNRWPPTEGPERAELELYNATRHLERVLTTVERCSDFVDALRADVDHAFRFEATWDALVCIDVRTVMVTVPVVGDPGGYYGAVVSDSGTSPSFHLTEPLTSRYPEVVER